MCSGSIDTRTELGRAFLEYSSKGQLVPDEITVKLWKARIDAAVDAHTFKPDIDTLILDGIPRNVAQAEIMDDVIDVQKVFHLSCPNRVALFERLKKRASRTTASTTRTKRSSSVGSRPTSRSRSRCSATTARTASPALTRPSRQPKFCCTSWKA
jgi:adenylate kinase family enzyme